MLMIIRELKSPLSNATMYFALFACTLNIASAADDEGPTYLDATSAGKDFAIQGEYVGVVEGGQTWGAQVVALGEGKFHCVGYPDGLPGDGYKPGTAKKESDGAFDGQVVKFKGDEFKLEIAIRTRTRRRSVLLRFFRISLRGAVRSWLRCSLGTRLDVDALRHGYCNALSVSMAIAFAHDLQNDSNAHSKCTDDIGKQRRPDLDHQKLNSPLTE